ncbi:MAG: polyhydroxybutyrate depolymerase [Pseudomonadota bacterium]
MVRTVLALLFSVASIVPAMAQVCGGENRPCGLVDGSYHLLLPDGEDPKGIVIHLHGGGGSGRGMLQSGMASEALVRGYVFVAPNGEHPEARWTQDWSVRADAMAFDRDDMDFISNVLADVRMRHELPEVPVLLAGFSRGGSMVWDIACHLPNFADAYAPMAGAFWESLPATCAGPVRLFHTHGWTDRVVPLEGRSFFDGSVVQGDVWASLKVLRENNGCRARQPERSSVEGDLWLRHWTDCDAGEITLLLHQGGHASPEGWAKAVMTWFETGQP